MISKALWVELQAQPGKEDDVEAFLNSAKALVESEPGTRTWYAIKLGPSSYGIFDTFDDEPGRNAQPVTPDSPDPADEDFTSPYSAPFALDPQYPDNGS